MTSFAALAEPVSWIATGLGVGLWLWAWFGEKNPIGRMRFQDAGMVLVFGAILLRITLQDRSMNVFDWVLVVLGPLFIAAALFRLSRTGAGRPPSDPSSTR